MTPNPYPLTISAFPTAPTISLTSDQLKEIIREAVEEATQPLRDQIEELQAWRDRKETREEIAVPSPEIAAVRAKTGLLEMRVDDAFEAISEIDQAIAKLRGAVDPPKQGTKTAQRIAKIETILKASGGSRSFKTLRQDLSLSSSQFSQLIAKIDKRRFIVAVNPRARDEKALRLRAFT